MTIDEILEMMDDMLDKAVTVPFSGKKCMIDADKLREYIDNIRYNLPTEIKKPRRSPMTDPRYLQTQTLRQRR